MLKPKKMSLKRSQVSHNAALNITHSAITSQDSSRVATTFNAHCTSTLHSGRSKRKMCTSRCKVGTIPYRTVRMTSRARVQCPGTATGTEHSVGISRIVYLSAKLKLQGQQSCLGESGIPQTGVTLSYTINPFGPSAGCIFILEMKTSLGG